MFFPFKKEKALLFLSPLFFLVRGNPGNHSRPLIFGFKALPPPPPPPPPPILLFRLADSACSCSRLLTWNGDVGEKKGPLKKATHLIPRSQAHKWEMIPLYCILY